MYFLMQKGIAKKGVWQPELARIVMKGDAHQVDVVMAITQVAINRLVELVTLLLILGALDVRPEITPK
jgi:hypothetical protein